MQERVNDGRLLPESFLHLLVAVVVIFVVVRNSVQAMPQALQLPEPAIIDPLLHFSREAISAVHLCLFCLVLSTLPCGGLFGCPQRCRERPDVKLCAVWKLPQHVGCPQPVLSYNARRASRRQGGYLVCLSTLAHVHRQKALLLPSESLSALGNAQEWVFVALNADPLRCRANSANTEAANTHLPKSTFAALTQKCGDV